VNLVQAITPCPGANVVQGGSSHAGFTTPCQGSAAPGCTLTATTFDGPNNISALLMGNVLTGSPTNWKGTGGCNATLDVKERTSGSGTRATICENTVGADLDCTATTEPDAPTTPTMLQPICGVPSNQVTLNGITGPAAGTAARGTLGYTSRAGTVAPYTQSANAANPGKPDTTTPLGGCGIVAINGLTGWNNTCNPAAPAGPDSTTNSLSNQPVCVGDYQVAQGQYTVWGYEHFGSNANITQNAAALTFLTFMNNATEDPNFQTFGFLRNCQMQQARSNDGGPYSAAPSTTC
jgi:hypothetical protein